MASIVRTYFDQVSDILKGISTNQTASLDAAANAVADSLKCGGLVYVVGSGHSHLIAADLLPIFRPLIS